jgi:hypothetical protein
MSRLASSDHQISGNWPLRYHDSPWLLKEFVQNYKASYCETPKMIYKCRKKDSFDSDVSLNGDKQQIAFKNETYINIITSSNRSALKVSNTFENNDISTASVLATTASDGTIATSPAPKFTDSLEYLNNQCLFLDGKSAKSICDSSQGVPRMRLLKQYQLKNCYRYPLANVLSGYAWEKLFHSVNSDECERILSELQLIDNIVNQLVCEYDSLLARYDCENGFSVKWSCDDCRVSKQSILITSLYKLIPISI